MKHKKDKQLFLHIDLKYFYQGNKTRVHTLSLSVVVQNQACSFNRKRLEQVCTLATERVFNFYCHRAHNSLNCNWDIAIKSSSKYVASEACKTTLKFLEKIPTDLIVICMCIINAVKKSIFYQCLSKNHRIAARILQRLAVCLTELSASDFYWMFFSFRLSWYFSFIINFPRFFKRLFRPTKILLLRHSQNSYQMLLYKLNLMCEELFYQIINTSPVNQAVFCYY